MNKIENYICLTKKAKALIKQHNLQDAVHYREKATEIAKNYTLEDLVSNFDSIGWKVDIEGVTKELLRAKKIYKQNGRKFNEFSIGELLLGNFADAYAERRGR